MRDNTDNQLENTVERRTYFMSYKILINERNSVLAGDIIRHTSDDCICYSTSEVWTDINVHIKFMIPDAYIIF